MRAKKILYATDFSTASESALGFASSLASDTGATLLIVYVDAGAIGYPPGDGAYGYFVDEAAAPEAHEEYCHQLQTIEPTVAGVQYVQRCLQGQPEEEILRFAQAEAVDLIVVGSHGRTGLSRMLMGSVAEAIVRRAECPVVVVKHAANLAEAAAEEG